MYFSLLCPLFAETSTSTASNILSKHPLIVRISSSFTLRMVVSPAMIWPTFTLAIHSNKIDRNRNMKGFMLFFAQQHHIPKRTRSMCTLSRAQRLHSESTTVGTENVIVTTTTKKHIINSHSKDYAVTLCYSWDARTYYRKADAKVKHTVPQHESNVWRMWKWVFFTFSTVNSKGQGIV